MEIFKTNTASEKILHDISQPSLNIIAFFVNLYLHASTKSLSDIFPRLISAQSQLQG
jgi:hypothetical protein